MFSYFNRPSGDSGTDSNTTTVGEVELTAAPTQPPSSSSLGFASFFSPNRAASDHSKLDDIELNTIDSKPTKPTTGPRTTSFFGQPEPDHSAPSAPSSNNVLSSFRSLLGATSPSESDMRVTYITESDGDDVDLEAARSSDFGSRLSGVVDSVKGYISAPAPAPVDNSFKGKVNRKCAELSDKVGCSSMSYTNRLIGFAICVFIGIACGFAVCASSLLGSLWSMLIALHRIALHR
jgi:hypothetical protein